MLDQADKQMKEMLASLGSSQPTPEAAVQARVTEFVGALGGVQQCFRDFASTPPTSRQQQLQQEIQSLEQELQRADRLIADADMKINDWQADIQALRTAHETVLTDNGNNTPPPQPTPAANGSAHEVAQEEGQQF